MSNSVVYVIQQPAQSREFGSAQKYGRVEFVLSSAEKVSILPARALGILRRRLKPFTKEDYIVWAGGDPFAPILAGIVLGEYGFSEINYLRWEREKMDGGLRSSNGYYLPGKLMLRSIVSQNTLHSEDIE